MDLSSIICWLFCINAHKSIHLKLSDNLVFIKKKFFWICTRQLQFINSCWKQLHPVLFNLSVILTSPWPQKMAARRQSPFPFWVRPLPLFQRARSLVSVVTVLCTGPSVSWFSVFWDWALSSHIVGPWTVQHWRSTGYSQTWISWCPASESTEIYKDTQSSLKVTKEGSF